MSSSFVSRFPQQMLQKSFSRTIQRPTQHLNTATAARTAFHVMQPQLGEMLAKQVQEGPSYSVLDLRPTGYWTLAMLDKPEVREMIFLSETSNKNRLTKLLEQEAPDRVRRFDGELQKLGLLEGCPPAEELFKGIPSTPWDAAHPSLVLCGGSFTVKHGLRLLAALCFHMADRTGPYAITRAPIYTLLPRYFFDKIYAKPRMSGYDRTTVLVQGISDIEPLAAFNRNLFEPVVQLREERKQELEEAPVYLVKITPKVQCGIPVGQCLEFDYVLRRILHKARAPLSKTIKFLGPNADTLLKKMDIDPASLGLDLTPEQYVELTRLFIQWPDKPKSN